MYWPVGPPKIYAASSRGPHVISHDGLDSSTTDLIGSTSPINPPTPASEAKDQFSASSEDHTASASPAQLRTQPPKQEVRGSAGSLETDSQTRATHDNNVLALRGSRNGHLFFVLTATSITIWQAKPSVVVGVVIRSQSSIATYGKNVDLMIRPDSTVFVVRTAHEYLITYSLALDSDARLYKPYFTSHTNVQKRRQTHAASGAMLPDQYLWGPGEGEGILDLNIRFRMAIKIDAGIASVLALDHELVVATRKPAAIQCILWVPDNHGVQTKTEMVDHMPWLRSRVTILEMTHDRPMNLSAWVTSDGRAHAVQSLSAQQGKQEEGDSKRLFHGYSFHSPASESDRACRTMINARFSLIAVGCAGGDVHVYSARDYAGNIAHSHVHTLPVSSNASGSLTTLSYSPDGYCLFAGFEKGWATWSVYGKLGAYHFSDDSSHTSSAANLLPSVDDALWLGGGCELLITSRHQEVVWVLEMARSAITGFFNPTSLVRTTIQTSTNVMTYRGFDIPDLSSISSEPYLWHTTTIPAAYLLRQWPIRHTVVSGDGRYIAVAGRRGLAHYSVNSGRWKTFTHQSMEDEFQVRGGMCWYQHMLVAAVEMGKSHELRLFSREASLESSLVLHSHPMPAPIILITLSGEDSLLVYTHENLLYHFIIAPYGGTMRVIQLGQIAFHGIVRSPARVRGLSWILPESQLAGGDPSQDVTVASILLLVDAKLVLLKPLDDAGRLKYDMRVISQNVEFYISMRDQPDRALASQAMETGSATTVNEPLRDSLWVFDGRKIELWPDVQEVVRAVSLDSKETQPAIQVPADFYPLSPRISKGVMLGLETNISQRREADFPLFRFETRTHLFIPDVLRAVLNENDTGAAVKLAKQYEQLEYFPHALEMLLHQVLDEEADTSPEPNTAILPRVLSTLASFNDYLDIVVQCTRKTEVRQWRSLFAYLPPVHELFEESLQQGHLKTAGSYLIVLHTLDQSGTAPEQTVRLLSRAMQDRDWELCKELARFLAAVDEQGSTLHEVMATQIASE